MCKHHSISFEYITPYGSTPYRSREMVLDKNYSHKRERERHTHTHTHTHTHQISFLNKRHIEVQDRCSIRFWCMIQGENITIEGACLSHDIKTAKHRRIFLFYQRNCWCVFYWREFHMLWSYFMWENGRMFKITLLGNQVKWLLHQKK